MLEGVGGHLWAVAAEWAAVAAAATTRGLNCQSQTAKPKKKLQIQPTASTLIPRI